MPDKEKSEHNALPDAAVLIKANIQRFEVELRSGYEKIQSLSKNHKTEAKPVSFEAWAFKLVEAVFSDMLDAKVNHKSADAYTSDVGRRLKMKILGAVRQANQDLV